MRIVVSCLTAAVAVAACGQKAEQAAAPPATNASASASATASLLTLGPDQLPRFRPGMWEVSKTDGGETEVSRECIGDEATAEIKDLLTKETPGCKTNRSASPAGIKIHSACEQGGVKTESSFVMTGSPTTYNGRVTISVTTPQGRQEAADVTLKAKWTGACPAGVKPGESVE